MKKELVVFLLFLTLLVSGCLSRIDPYKEDITSVEIFQKAYEATDVRNYSLAVSYYEAYMKRFPEDVKGCLWAQYEIAFIYHKKGNDVKALELFTELLKRYEGEESTILPEAPKVLSQKVILAITSKKDKDKMTE